MTLPKPETQVSGTRSLNNQDWAVQMVCDCKAIVLESCYVMMMMSYEEEKSRMMYIHPQCTIILNFAPTYISNKDLGIWNEPAKKMIIEPFIVRQAHFIILIPVSLILWSSEVDQMCCDIRLNKILLSKVTVRWLRIVEYQKASDQLLMTKWSGSIFVKSNTV